MPQTGYFFMTYPVQLCKVNRYIYLNGGGGGGGSIYNTVEPMKYLNIYN